VHVDEHFLDELRRTYEPDVERLATDFPEIDRNLWPSFAES
jgi:hypothetical protein